MGQDIISKNRCFGNGVGKEFYAAYHDEEWGMPSHDDRHLFEMLILEGAQAGLSWETILRRRQGYRAAFYNFDPQKVARMTQGELDVLQHETSIIRNKLKIKSVPTNAQVFLALQNEHGSFAKYLWQFVNGRPIKNQWSTLKEIPTRTPLSDTISKDLKRRGMSFVGSTIIYAYLQAVGVVNDHLTTCWRYGSAHRK